MILDGRAIAERVFSSLVQQPLSLGVLLTEGNPVTNSFVRIKAKAAERLGITLVRAEVSPSMTTGDAKALLVDLVRRTDGVIVQLPLPSELDADALIGAIPGSKDVDGISPEARVRPPVAAAIEEILMTELVPTRGRKAVVVGSGRLVGAPSARLLRELGAEVQVLAKGDSLDVLKNADIVVLGAGEPGLIKPEHIKDGVVLIDAGTSESNGKVAGDADPACAEKASVFTPVPGGVGPIAVAMIFRNLFELAKK